MSTDLKYKWDTTEYCKNQEEFEKQLEYLKNAYKQVENYKGKLNNKVELKKYLELSDNLSDVIEKIANSMSLSMLN